MTNLFVRCSHSFVCAGFVYSFTGTLNCAFEIVLLKICISQSTFDIKDFYKVGNVLYVLLEH